MMLLYILPSILSQANGLVERFNQTLQRMLTKYVHTQKKKWSSFLDTCVFAYNTSRHEASQFTPFELMFSRRATLPIDLDIKKSTPEQEVLCYANMDEPDLLQLAKERVERLEEAKTNILAAQKKQKEYYDRKHAKPHLFEKGQLVLKKDFKRKKRKGGKLDTRFLGPYVINKKLGRGIYELMAEDGKSTVRVTGTHLKPFNRESYFPSNCAESSHVSQIVSCYITLGF